ncbi:MAG: family 20 glycosylhydrolase [Clostridium sp.]|nr:family 20 glycosylhydrolase [Clostridium sp.]
MKRLNLLLASLAVASATALFAANPKPFTVPEVSEWKGQDGFNILPSSLTVAYDGAACSAVAGQFADDYATMFGTKPSLKDSRKGNITLRLASDRKLGDEGYTISVTPKKIELTAATEAGLRWATRTLLQLREASDSIPCGKITDIPAFGFRGFMIDCGRKYIPMDYLRKLVDVMAYYKMNKLHIHLNDNGFKCFYDDDWDKTQAAFRLESETFPGLTARDGSYTKQEFRDFQDYAASRGVEIIPEIDFPAHSLAFTRFRPEIGSADDEYGRDHLDLTKEATYEFLDSLLAEYLGGDDPVFKSPRFHIGTDEYSNRDSLIVEKFRYLTDRYIRQTEGYGKTPVVWGALTHAKGRTPVKADGVEMYLWYNGYADPAEMLEAGYKVVSIPDGYVYIVPEAGYYYNYLNTPFLYEKWTPAVIGDQTVDPANPQLLGGAFALWNDHPGNGVTVKDIHHRVMQALPTIATKTWTPEGSITVPFEEFAVESRRLSEAPGVNYLGRPASVGEDGLVLSIPVLTPGSETGLEEIGYNYDVEFDIVGADEKKGTVLLESPSATVWISDPITGNLAFSREDKLYQFRHNIRPGEKSHIRIVGDNRSTRLYVDGRLVDDLGVRRVSYNGSDRKMGESHTLVFPLAKAGDFHSRVTGLKVRWTDCPVVK